MRKFSLYFLVAFAATLFASAAFAAGPACKVVKGQIMVRADIVENGVAYVPGKGVIGTINLASVPGPMLVAFGERVDVDPGAIQGNQWYETPKQPKTVAKKVEGYYVFKAPAGSRDASLVYLDGKKAKGFRFNFAKLGKNGTASYFSAIHKYQKELGKNYVCMDYDADHGDPNSRNCNRNGIVVFQ